jgi:hypothetical protein
MSIHDIIHTDSLVVTAWLSKHGTRLVLIIILAIIAVASVNALRELKKSEHDAAVEFYQHQGVLSR